MKKLLKKVVALALVLVQIVPMITVSAISGTNVNTKGKITINGAHEGKTYDIYQVLKLESFDQGKAYSYTVNTGWESFVNNAEDSDGNKYLTVNELGYVSWNGLNSDARKAEFAKKALAYAKAANPVIAPTDTKVAGNTGTVIFENLNLGYYLVDSSAGALCHLDTTDAEVVINEKNGVPTVEKYVYENGNKQEENTASIGDTVDFETVITVTAGAHNYVLHDTMSKGLTLDKTSIVVNATNSEGNSVTTTGKYTVKETPDENDTFTITFDDDFVGSLADGKIVVTYSALLNEEAVLAPNANTNDTDLSYGDGHRSNKDQTKTYTYLVGIVKTTSDKTVLNGAGFRLYKKDSEAGTIVKVALTSSENGVNVYRVLDDQSVEGDGALIEAGIVRIEGLDLGDYYLIEEVIPEGYNKLAKNPEFRLDANNDATVTEGKYVEGGVQVINYTGNELPSTGGMGTVLFLTIGSIMVLGFGVLLVTKFRMSKMAL